MSLLHTGHVKEPVGFIEKDYVITPCFSVYNKKVSKMSLRSNSQTYYQICASFCMNSYIHQSRLVASCKHMVSPSLCIKRP